MEIVKTTMKRELLAAVVMAMATVGVARADGTNTPAAAATPPAAAPKIQFDKTVYNFGTTSLVDSVTGTFTFQNVGAADLKISKPQPSCGCTVASVKPDVLKPGEKGELVFTVRVTGQRGQLEKHITVPSNDPQSSSVNLAIKIEMKQIIEVTTPTLSIGALRQGETTNLSVVLRRTDGQKLVIASTQPSSKTLAARVEPVEGSNGESVKLLIDAHPEGAPHAFNDNVNVFLVGISQPAATVSVNGRLLGDVVLDHEQLYWPVTTSSNTPPQNQALPMRRITVSSTRTNQPLQITNLNTSLTNLTVELVTVETGKVYSVIAKFAESPQQSERGTISFNTNTSIQPTIVVPVTVVVLRK
jgi:hypothetical protein